MKNKNKNNMKLLGIVGLTTLGTTLCGCNKFEEVNNTLYGPEIPPSEEIDIRFNPEDNLIEPMYGTIQDRELNTIKKDSNIKNENQEESLNNENKDIDENFSTIDDENIFLNPAMYGPMID